MGVAGIPLFSSFWLSGWLSGGSKTAKDAKTRLAMTPCHATTRTPRLATTPRHASPRLSDRSRLDFRPQLGTKNRPKSLKNRCQDALRLGSRFLIDFSSICALNFDPRNLKNRAPAAARARILKNRQSTLTSIFDPILVPTWLHFGSPSRPKFVQKSIPKRIKKLIDFLRRSC